MARFISPVSQIILIVCLSLLPSRNSSAVIQLLLHKVSKNTRPAEGAGLSSTQHLPPTAGPLDDQTSNVNPSAAGLTSSHYKLRDPKTFVNKEKNGWLKVPLKPSEGDSDQSEAVSSRQSGQDNGDSTPSQAMFTAERRLKAPKQFPLKDSGETVLILRLPRHNIKRSWCHMHPFEQEIRHHGCNATVVNNNMCYGQCNSFFIPGNFVSCSRCAPSTWKILQVQLKCPGRDPDVVVKTVKVTESCDCRPCDI